MDGCPDCGQPLLIYEMDGVETDHCLGCGGTWLDSGELELVVEKAGVDPALLVAALDNAPRGEKGVRRCPRGRKRMRVTRLGPGDGVELDICSAGHGLWLDKGEMADVADAFSEGAGDAVALYFNELYPTERREG